MKKTFSSCPHDVAKDPEKWLAFIEYLNRKNVTDLNFERFLSFDEFAKNFDRFVFVYAHPLHVIQLASKGFIPLAKYTAIYDEAALIASKSISSPSVQNMQDKKIACINGTPSHAAFLIDLNKNHPGVEFDSVFKDTYPDVLMAVSIAEAQYGVILKSVWDQMVSMKDRVNHFYTTAVKELVHVFMIRGDHGESARPLQRALIDMNKDVEGKKILQRLSCDSLSEFGEKELQTLKQSLSVCKFEF